MLLNKILSFVLLVLGMTLFVFVWLCLDFFTRGL